MLNGMETNKVKTYWQESTQVGFGPWSYIKEKNLGSKEMDPNNLPLVGDMVVSEYGLWKVTNRFFHMEDGSWNFIVTNITRYKDEAEHD